MKAEPTGKAIARAIFDRIERDGNIVLANLEAVAIDVLAGAMAREEKIGPTATEITAKDVLKQWYIDDINRLPKFKPLFPSDPPRPDGARHAELLHEAQARARAMKAQARDDAADAMAATFQIEPVNPHIDPRIRRAEELRKMQEAIMNAPPSLQRALAGKVMSGVGFESAILGGSKPPPAEVIPNGQVPAAYGPNDGRASS